MGGCGWSPGEGVGLRSAPAGNAKGAVEDGNGLRRKEKRVLKVTFSFYTLQRRRGTLTILRACMMRGRNAAATNNPN